MRRLLIIGLLFLTVFTFSQDFFDQEWFMVDAMEGEVIFYEDEEVVKPKIGSLIGDLIFVDIKEDSKLILFPLGDNRRIIIIEGPATGTIKDLLDLEKELIQEYTIV